MQIKFIHFATISFKKHIKKAFKRYENYFGDHIIPFTKDGDMLATIIDRANKRIPPFSVAKDVSDKGFNSFLKLLQKILNCNYKASPALTFDVDDDGELPF